MHIGLKASYKSLNDLEVLKKEKKRLESITHRKVKYATCSLYKMNVPQAYRNFVELEIEEDYTMGYKEYSGFRAGTCTPFMFYDLGYEVQTPLMVYPFCVVYDGAVVHKRKDKREIQKEVHSYITKIKKVGGVFIPIFSNAILNESYTHTGFWKLLFQNIWNDDEVL